MEEPPLQGDSSLFLRVLEALKQASHELQTDPVPHLCQFDSAAIRALLELQAESDAILSKDLSLCTLSQHLSDFKTLVGTLQNCRGHSLASFLTRRAATHAVSRVAGSIESELQAWIDRESVENLTRALKKKAADEGELIKLLTHFEDRLSRGFDRELQDLLLKSKMFSLLESILCNPNCVKRAREHSAYAIGALIRFNKDVFVSEVLRGRTIHALVTLSSSHSIEVLCSLIRLIKSPLVDEIEANGEIPKIISFLSCQDLEMRVLALNCVLEIGYFGRKEAVDAMLGGSLIKKLVELQRSELGGYLIEMGKHSEEDDDNRGGKDGEVEGKRESGEKRFLESHPFASCVARFAVQLEVGEGLRQREKRAFKQEILVRVKETSVSDADAAAIAAEVLWGSTP